MQFIVLLFLTFNVSTCITRKHVYKYINRCDRCTCLTHMCKAGFADGIQNIAVLPTFGLFLKTY